jgi:hypothetical protein
MGRMKNLTYSINEVFNFSKLLKAPMLKFQPWHHDNIPLKALGAPKIGAKLLSCKRLFFFSTSKLSVIKMVTKTKLLYFHSMLQSLVSNFGVPTNVFLLAL